MSLRSCCVTLVAQALTAGRLQRSEAEPGLYGVRYDPTAEQIFLKYAPQRSPSTPTAATANKR